MTVKRGESIVEYIGNDNKLIECSGNNYTLCPRPFLFDELNRKYEARRIVLDEKAMKAHHHLLNGVINDY